jgi:hypothetical protein
MIILLAHATCCPRHHAAVSRSAWCCVNTALNAGGMERKGSHRQLDIAADSRHQQAARRFRICAVQLRLRAVQLKDMRGSTKAGGST